MDKKYKKPKKPLLFARLEDHFDADPAQLVVLEQNYPFSDTP